LCENHDRPLTDGNRVFRIKRIGSVGKLLFQITGAFAEFERSMIRTRVNAGLKRAKDQIKRDGHFVTKRGKVKKRLSRPADPDKLRKARAELVVATIL
jgi:DNA invertase Pin-like site-specific DNA recombinase